MSPGTMERDPVGGRIAPSQSMSSYASESPNPIYPDSDDPRSDYPREGAQSNGVRSPPITPESLRKFRGVGAWSP
jgi:hypothetical protein